MYGTLGIHPRRQRRVRRRRRRGGRGRAGDGTVVVVAAQAQNQLAASASAAASDSESGSYSYESGSYSQDEVAAAGSPYDDGSSSSDDSSYESYSSDSYESDSQEGDRVIAAQARVKAKASETQATAVPIAAAAAAAPAAPTAEQQKLTSIHSDLLANENYGKELLFHDKVPCKACGKLREALDAFDHHECDPSAAQADAAVGGALESALGDEHRSHIDRLMACAGIAAADFSPAGDDAASSSSECDDSGDSTSESADGDECVEEEEAKPAPEPECEPEPVCEPDVTRTEPVIKARRKHKKKQAPAPGCDGTEEALEYAETYDCWMSKAAKKLSESRFVDAVVGGQPLEMAFRGKGGSLVALRGALGVSRSNKAENAYYVSVAIAPAGTRANAALKLRRAFKFTADPVTTELKHKLVANSVKAIHAEIGDKALVAANLKPLLGVVKKITE